MIRLCRPRRIAARLEVPGDKSISQRLLLFAALARGGTEIENLSSAPGVRRMALALSRLGADIHQGPRAVRIVGCGGRLVEAAQPLSCGESGTTARLLAGALSAQPIFSVLVGGGALTRRPMSRVTGPLAAMGARIWGREQAGRLPLAILGGPLKGRTHVMDVPSAQVKSALLLAGLSAAGETKIREPAKSRDHSERWLRLMGARLRISGLDVCVTPGPLDAVRAEIPGDFSSAAPFIVLAVLHPRAEVEIRNLGLNPTRTGLLDALRSMGAEIEMEITRGEPEPVGLLRARSSDLRAIELPPDMVPRMIDELPLLALAATQARGQTVIRGLGELRVKESDRIRGTVDSLRKLGGRIEELADGFCVEGATPLSGGASLQSGRDHRMAMMCAVGAMIGSRETVLRGEGWVKASYPGFWKELARVRRV